MDFLNPMKKRKKKYVTCCTEEDDDVDVISNLPEHLVYSILERLPIEDAVRTSVLSKKWRYIWTTISSRDFRTPLQLLHSSNDDEVVHVSLSLKPPIIINDNVQRVERFNLLMMLIKMSNIVSFAIDGYFLKFLGLEKSPKWLPHMLKCVKQLEIESFNFGDLDQVQGALCMLRNSPNLEVLRLAYMMPQMGHDAAADLEFTSNYLDSPDCWHQTIMLRLNTVDIKYFEGSKPELLFVKLLLNHSIKLEDMIIRLSATADIERNINIVKDVLFFSRASNKAKIFYPE
ncbi:hypothetical protein SSX86_003414 [Deinandra increscens subsp. villosa]|uniref:F-box domain-containing protein n=1 Tax=Deinandra increscens subsp. villosa TaxID=3103831 RepID=A0AAP0DL22_9ASTR